MHQHSTLRVALVLVAAIAICGGAAGTSVAADDAYRPSGSTYPQDAYRPQPRDDVYRPAANGHAPDDRYDDTPPPPQDRGTYGDPYSAPRDNSGAYDGRPSERYQGYDGPREQPGYYEQGEILDAGKRFFGSVSAGLANAVEHTFRKSGRPNGYILGEDVGGAFVAGLRYGEGTLYTKDAGTYRVYWQGPSLGYDVGGAGSKTMVLVYNLHDPSDVYRRFAGVEGSAYVVGGVSVQYQQNGEVIMAPIRSGVGLRLGANVGYLKYTRSPTWNPF